MQKIGESTTSGTQNATKTTTNQVFYAVNRALQHCFACFSASNRAFLRFYLRLRMAFQLIEPPNRVKYISFSVFGLKKAKMRNKLITIFDPPGHQDEPKMFKYHLFIG